MLKAVLLDVGGVMVAPATGDWVLGPGYEAFLTPDFVTAWLPKLREVRRALLSIVPDVIRDETDDQEYATFLGYYRRIFDEMGYEITDAQIEGLSHAQVYLDDRYTLFGDVLSYLPLWRKTFKLGIVSDAPPSTRRILGTFGVLEHMDGATFSCELGVLKPDPRIYLSTLAKLGVRPEDAVFVDDVPEKLEGAVALGIRGIQMRRPMPPLYPVAELWNGPVAHDFQELDGMLRAM